MKRGKKKNTKCKIRASYSRNSYTLTRDLCFYIYIYIYNAFGVEFPCLLVDLDFFPFLQKSLSLKWLYFFLWNFSEEPFSLCLDFLLDEAIGGKPYCVQKFPTLYLALLLLAWLCIFISLHIFIPSLRMVLKISPQVRLS